MRRRFLLASAIALALAVTPSCAVASDAGGAPAESSSTGATCAASVDADGQPFPDVLDAELEPSGDEFTISVTMCSPYDTPDRYADGWRVVATDGDVLAEHVLTHDHANEQPFTRTRGPFAIPDDIDQVTVEGHDQANGYGGETVTVDVPR